MGDATFRDAGMISRGLLTIWLLAAPLWAAKAEMKAKTQGVDPASFEAIVQRHPQAVRERLILARYYLQRARFADANRLIGEVLAHDPKQGRAQKLAALSKRMERAVRLIGRWRRAWESADFSRYAECYGSRFRSDPSWRKRRQARLARAGRIEVRVSGLMLLPDADGCIKAGFNQVYQAMNHHDEGFKTLRICCDANGHECKIEGEEWIGSPR